MLPKGIARPNGVIQIDGGFGPLCTFEPTIFFVDCVDEKHPRYSRSCLLCTGLVRPVWCMVGRFRHCCALSLCGGAISAGVGVRIGVAGIAQKTIVLNELGLKVLSSRTIEECPNSLNPL